MKKTVLIISVFLSFVLLFGCSNAKKSDDNRSKHTTNSKKTTITEAPSSDLEGEPSEKLTPKVNNIVVEDFDTYDKLSQDEQAQLIYNYLLSAMTAIGGGKEGAKDLLKEAGYEISNIGDLSVKFSELRKQNKDADFDELMQKMVESVIRK